MKIEIDLIPDQISKVVSKELMYFYDELIEDRNFDLGTNANWDEVTRALHTIIEYYTPPSEFDAWRKG